MAEKRQQRDSIEIDRDGKKVVGTRMIEGTNKLFQTIYYAGRSKADGRAYRPHDGAIMSAIAEVILRELYDEAKHRP